jgi:GAF domain-containing protein/HAMP domain-containing protein
VIAVVISQTISRPLVNLTNAAQRIAAGEAGVQAEVASRDEIGTLATSFNDMTAQLSRRASDLATVAEVGTATSTLLETKQLLQKVVDLSKERFHLYHSHIYLLDNEGKKLVLAAGADDPGRQMLEKGLSIPLDREQSLVARAARERRGVIVNDVRQEPDFLPNPLLPDTRSELAVPMIIGDQLLGVFDVQSDTAGHFTDLDINIQTTLASQVATSLQNARSYSETQEAQKLTRNVIDSTDDWIFIKDQNHRYRLVNQGYANSLHIPIADFIGKNDIELGFPEELVKGNPEKGIPGFWAIDRAVMDGGVAKRIPDDLVSIDGKIHIFDTVKVPLRDADNKVWGVLAFARDTTERRNLEETNRKRAVQQEAINLITQKIQFAVTIEDAMQVAARELGHALGMKPTLVALESDSVHKNKQGRVNPPLPSDESETMRTGGL